MAHTLTVVEPIWPKLQKSSKTVNHPIYNYYFYPLCLWLLFLLRSAISGLLGYIFLVNIGWKCMFLVIGLSSLFWTLSIRWLSRKHEKKMHYRLLDNDSKEHATINVNIEKSEPTCVDVPWRLLLKQPPVLWVFHVHSLVMGNTSNFHIRVHIYIYNYFD